jgi:DNA-binding winged helix-turn-helix (wHTH) protein
MEEPRLPSAPIRFGIFEVQAGELRRQGFKIRLQEQPFQILVMLLERPGEVVPREDLQKRLWPADTFVDFERGLNRAMNKLREALGDNSESPRFVETLPRRGYRFIAPVETAESYPSLSPAVSQPEESSKKWRLLAAAGALGAVLLSLGLNVGGMRTACCHAARYRELHRLPSCRSKASRATPRMSISRMG